MRILYCSVQIILFVGFIHVISANHQHQVTFSEGEDGETSYGYQSSPSSSVTYEDEDSYGAEESSNNHRLITGSGRMTVLDKRIDTASSETNQSLYQQQNYNQQQQPLQLQQQIALDTQSQNVDSYDQYSIPPVMNNLRVAWTEHIDHSPSKSSSEISPLSSSSPSYYAQNVPRYPINHSSNDNSGFSPSSHSALSSDNSNVKKYNGAINESPSVGYADNSGHQGHYNEPYVGYSESRQIESEWEFPEWLKELKKNEKDDEKKEEKKVDEIETKKEPKKPKYEVDPWEEPGDKKEELNDKKEDKEKKDDDKSEYEWSDPWNENLRKENKKQAQPERKKKDEGENYGNKIKKEDEDKGDKGKEGKEEKYETHTHHHHDHRTDHWYSEPKKEKKPEKKEEKYEEENYDNEKYSENQNNKHDNSYRDDKKVSLPVYSEDNYKKESDSWYNSKEEEKYREPEKEEEKKDDYHDSKNDYSKYQDNGFGTGEGDKYSDEKPTHDNLEKPEQVGRRPSDQTKDHKSGGLLESYFWKALPGSVIGDKTHDKSYNYVIHVSKIDLDKGHEKKKDDDKVNKDY